MRPDACDCTVSAVARLDWVQRISARERPWRSSSAGTDCTVPRPNSTRTACDWKTKGSVMLVLVLLLQLRLDRGDGVSFQTKALTGGIDGGDEGPGERA